LKKDTELERPRNWALFLCKFFREFSKF